MSRDIAALLNIEPQKASKSLNERMNALVADADRELINNWHPRRPKHLWPKGISK
jgi:hypothetical protein